MQQNQSVTPESYRDEANFTMSLDGYDNNNRTNNTSDFNVFELFDSPENDIPDLTTTTEDPSSSSFSKSPGYDLLVIGLILLGVGVWINVAVQTFVACRRRKRQRAISPSPDDIAIARRGETNGAVPQTISQQRHANDDEESQTTAAAMPE